MTQVSFHNPSGCPTTGLGTTPKTAARQLGKPTRPPGRGWQPASQTRWWYVGDIAGAHLALPARRWGGGIKSLGDVVPPTTLGTVPRGAGFLEADGKASASNQIWFEPLWFKTHAATAHGPYVSSFLTFAHRVLSHVVL